MQHNLNWSDEQWAIVEEQAEAAGMTPGDYIRRKATQPDLPATLLSRLTDIARGINRPLHFVVERILSDWLARDFAEAVVNLDAPKLYPEFVDFDGDPLATLTRQRLDELHRECIRKQLEILRSAGAIDTPADQFLQEQGIAPPSIAQGVARMQETHAEMEATLDRARAVGFTE